MKKENLLKIKTDLFAELNSRLGTQIANKKTKESCLAFRCSLDYAAAIAIVVIDNILENENLSILKTTDISLQAGEIFEQIEKENLGL